MVIFSKVLQWDKISTCYQINLRNIYYARGSLPILDQMYCKAQCPPTCQKEGVFLSASKIKMSGNHNF
jgi:hypothetical protein